MKYEIGQSYMFDGQERMVIGVDGSGHPVTSPKESVEEAGSSTDVVPRATGSEIQREELMVRIGALEHEISSLALELQGARAEKQELLEENERLRFEQEQAVIQIKVPEVAGKTAQEVLAKDMTCKHCGRTCGSPVGLTAHEKACEKNPESANYKA